MKADKIIGAIATIIFLVFATILIIQILLKLTGHSPTETQLLYIATGAIASYILVMSYKLGMFIGKSKEFMSSTKEFMSSTQNALARLQEIKSR